MRKQVMDQHTNANHGNLPISLVTSNQNTEVLPASDANSDTSRLAPCDQDRLIMEHMTTVRFIARRMRERLPQHIDLEDLVSAGVVGLIDAVQKFDHGKQVQFKSYAQFRIKGAILDSLRSTDWSPRELRRQGRAVEAAVQSLTAGLGRSPNQTEIAAEMGVSLHAYQELLGSLKSLEVGSLNVERSDEYGEEELNYIPGPVTDDPLFSCLKGEMRERLMLAIDNLPEKERLVLSLYYFEELTMKEIGATINVVESRVSQIRAAAVKRLRSSLNVAHPGHQG